MSETLILPPAGADQAKRVPTVYFIDDSATMREVIRIAFRRENIHVISCPDANSALAQFEQNPPDAVITDVIMPDQDGFAVCSQIKQNPQYSSIPVILMSGVVNKNVADKAVAVHADELIRKPFQPQELIGRVKSLLQPKDAPPQTSGLPHSLASNPLSGLFAPAPAQPAAAPAPPAARPPQAGEPAWPRALAEAFAQYPAPSAASPPRGASSPDAPHPAAPANKDIQKLRCEIMHLELLVKKLQTELQIEREYNQTLELHIRALQSAQ